MNFDLTKQYQKLEDKINALTQDQTSLRLKPDTWDIAQILDHIGKVEIGMAKAVGSNKGAPVEKDRILSTEDLSVMSLNREVKLKAPSFSAPEADVQDVEVSMEIIKNNRQKLTDLINTGKVDWLRAAPPHPFIGPLGKKDWYDFIYLHMERHIAQIDEILESHKD